MVILPREEDKVIGSSTLELFVGNRFQMLSIILSYSRVVPANYDIPRLLLVGLERGHLYFRIFHLASVREAVSSCTRYAIVVISKPVVIDIKGPVCSRLLLSLKVAEGLVLCVVLRPWQVDLRGVCVQVGSWRRFESLTERVSFLDLELWQHALREILTWPKRILHFFLSVNKPVFEGSKHLRVVMHYRLHTKCCRVMMLQVSTWTWSNIILR